MSKGRDGTVPRFFNPVPHVPGDNHAGQSREILFRPRSSRYGGVYSCPGLFVSRRNFSTGTVPQICHCPVALSPGPGANPGNLRDQDRDPDIVPGQPPIPDHNCRFVDHLRSSYFQNTKLISGAMSKIIAVFVFVTFIGAIFVGVFISG